jgi:hypothetical protein
MHSAFRSVRAKPELSAFFQAGRSPDAEDAEDAAERVAIV